MTSGGGTAREGVAAKGLAAGAACIALTLVMALLANSLLLWADLAATVLDFAAVYLAWWTLRRASRGRLHSAFFAQHLGRLESVGSLGIGVVMIATFAAILVSGVWRLAAPVRVEGVGLWIGLGVNAVYAAVNGWLCWRSYTEHRRAASPVLLVQGRLFAIKLASNIVVIVSLGLSLGVEAGWVLYVDPAAAIVLAATLLVNGLDAIRFSVRDLVDAAMDEASHLAILGAVMEHADQFEALLGIRTRRGPDGRYVDVRVAFAPDLRMAAVQATTDAIADAVSQALGPCDVTVTPISAGRDDPAADGR